VGIAKALYVGTNVNVAGTLGVTGVATFSAAPIYSSLTASSAVATDASKGLVSVTNTGTGNNVLATSPTLVTPILGAASATSITFDAGAVGTPSITTTGDTNTGIFFPAADTIAFAEGGSEVMRIDSSGNVGIGTSSPSTYGKLAVTGTSAFGVDQSDYIAMIGGVGTARLETAGSTANSNLAFSTQGTGAVYFWRGGYGGTASAIIDGSGNLLVGRTSQLETEKFGVTSANIAALLVGTNTGNVATLQIRRADTDGDAVTFFRGTTQKGYITVTSTGTTYNTLSDYRLKENIAPMVGALEKVAALKPVTYDWKDIGKTGQGFIAHELKEVVSECVTGEKDAVDENGNPVYQGIDTSFLVATLTAAIQELKALVDTQSSTITALTARITALETK
jgi:hypothetical protein